MKIIVVYISVAIAAGILLVNIYTSVVDAASWASAFPESVANARKYFSVVNPGTFFRVFSPVNQVFALLSLILFWKFPGMRNYLGAAFLIYIASDAFTFGYFYPRNELIFTTSLTDNAEGIKSALTQWTFMNWVRSAVVLAGLICSMIGLHRYYKTV